MAIADNMPNDRPQDLMRRIGDIERAIRELRAARNLDKATITALAGLGIRTSDFDGTDFAHPGTTGNYFGGDGLVANSLYLRPGSVGNDALTNPLEPVRAHADADNFAVPNSFGTIMSMAVTVPAGFTKALILTLAIQASAINSSASTGWMYASGHIDGYSFGGWSVGSQDAAPGETAVTYDVTTQLLTGVSGSFVIEGWLTTNGGGVWSANAANVANMDASILFLR